MLLNCDVGEDSWESLGLQGNPTSPSWTKSFLNIHWKDWCWSQNSNTLAIWCEELKRPGCWERLKARGEGDNRGWDGWMASLTQWTWVWVNSGNWWWTRRPGMLQSMGSQRVRQDWATELDWTIIFFASTIVWPQVNKREGTQLHPSTENGLKIYWAWPRPSEQDPVSSSVSLSHQEAFISLLSFSIRGQRDWKPPSQKTSQPNHMTTALSNSMNYEQCHVWPPKTDRSWWRILTKCGPLEKANHFSILALRTPCTVWKGKKIGHWKMNSPGQ